MTAEGMSDPDRRSDFEVIRDTLLQMDPETRHQVIQAMMALRGLPVPVAVRILAKAPPRPAPLIVPFG